MAKTTVVLSLLVSSVLLCLILGGCGGMLLFDDSDRKADVRMEQIFNIIKNHDKDGLKTVFSKQALSEADEFYENLDALFQYIQGSIRSWERTGTYGGRDERNVDGTGNRKKRIDSTYIFTTDEHEYRVAIYEIIIDTANPNNIGVYSICIISSEDDRYSEIRYWGNGKAGINIG